MSPFRIFLASTLLLGLTSFPPSSYAGDEFSPTVKIIAYRQYLNGEIGVASAGSGTIVTKEGQILTNAHLVYDAGTEKPFDAFSICVTDNINEQPDCRFTATLERYEEKIDLAVLQIDNITAWGNRPTHFPFLTYRHGIKPESGDSVTVRGFPTSGGVTINTTKGQVSGFDEYNGYRYLKTDADIDAGNSGGTMLDANGNFIGIPSHLVSYYENSGRALHTDEIVTWIMGTSGKKASANEAVAKMLRAKWKTYNDSSVSRKINFSRYPKISAEIPAGWRIGLIDDNTIFLIKEDSDQSLILMKIGSNGFALELNETERLDFLEKSFGKEAFDGHESIEVGGKKGLHLWDDLSGGSAHTISLDYGYKEIIITYSIIKEEKAATERAVKTFLESIKFNEPEHDDLNPSHKLDEANYPFTLETPTDDLRVVTEDMEGGNLALIIRKILKLESISVYYSEMDKGPLDFTMEDGMNYMVDKFLPEDSKVVFKTDKLKVDGLPGWMVIYELTEHEVKRKFAHVVILDPEYELHFDLRTEASEFGSQLENFVSILRSFKSKRYDKQWNEDWDEIFDPKKQGEYNIPYPNAESTSGLSDIGGHRYKQNIERLVEMEVIGGYPDKTFKPEQPVNRAEALKIILQSLRSTEKDSGEEAFVMPDDWHQFSDLKADEWYATYVAEGMEKGIVKGYPDGTFKGGNTVNLAEALKMALEAHDAEVWEGESDPWHKKYFDAAHALELLPKDLTDPGKLLTRAELAYIVDQLVEGE